MRCRSCAPERSSRRPQLSSRRLVRELLKHVPEVPTALRDLVVDRADGNPFYIEELIKALIDDRVILIDTRDGVPFFRKT